MEQLQYHFEGLRGLFLYTLFALIALTVTLDLCFLRKQMIFVRTQLDDQRPKVGKLVAEYRKGTEPLVKSFTASLQSFTASNHDFQVILDKYRPILWPYMITALSEPTPLMPGKTSPVPPK